MAILTTTTIVQGTLESLLSALSEPRHFLKISSQKPSLFINAPKKNKKYGHIIESTIFYGLFSLPILASVKEYHPNSYITSTQFDGPFNSWVHTQSFRINGADVVIEDTIEYTTASELLKDIMSQISLCYPNQIKKMESHPSEMKTQKFKSIRKNIA